MGKLVGRTRSNTGWGGRRTKHGGRCKTASCWGQRFTSTVDWTSNPCSLQKSASVMAVQWQRTLRVTNPLRFGPHFFCRVISGQTSPLVLRASHSMPKRLGDAGIQTIFTCFTGLSTPVSRFHKFIGLTLSTTLRLWINFGILAPRECRSSFLIALH